jgi:hypothetical protein
VTVVAPQYVLLDSENRQLVVADSKDNLTIAWGEVVGDVTDAGDNRVGHAFASRSFDKGAHWSTPADLGASCSVTLAIGPSGDVVAATWGNGLGGGTQGGTSSPAGIALQTISATGTSWSAPVSTKVETGSGPCAPLSARQRILFDGKGNVILLGLQPGTDDAGQPTTTLQAVTCSL